MNLTDAIDILTSPYRNECVYSDGAHDYDADNLHDWASETEAAEADEEAGTKEYAVDGDAIYPVDGGFIQRGQPVVRLVPRAGWDWENATRTDLGAVLPARLSGDTWPDESAWRAWAVAR